jgi:hypothetical protein
MPIATSQRLRLIGKGRQLRRLHFAYFGVSSSDFPLSTICTVKSLGALSPTTLIPPVRYIGHVTEFSDHLGVAEIARGRIASAHRAAPRADSI